MVQGTAADVKLEDLPPENLKGEQKPWEFKELTARRQEVDGKTVRVFKVYKRGTDELLEGFENEEFNSPLVGGRYIASLLKAAEAKAATIAATLQPVPKPAEAVAGQASSATVIEGGVSGKAGFEIPLIGEEPEIHQVGAVQYFELRVHEQDGDAKRKDIFLTDGVSRDFQILLDTPVILPAGCLNVLRESIYTEHECVDRSAVDGSVLLLEKHVPRFAIQIIREVPQGEAEGWLREKKRTYLQYHQRTA